MATRGENTLATVGDKEEYFESPTFTGFSSFALTFVFSGRIKANGEPSVPDNVRLSAARTLLASSEGEAYRQLVLPTQSFFSDILATEIPLQRRPLIVAGESESAASDRRVSLVRPGKLRYFAEGREVSVQNDGTELLLEFRDVYALFESGHLFYALSFIPDITTKVNEYHIISLQKLANPTEDTETLRQSVCFRCADGKVRTLVDFVAWRQAQLVANEKHPNAIRSIFSKILKKKERVPAYGWDSLRSLLVAIEDPHLFQLATGGAYEPTEGLPKKYSATSPHMAPDTTAELAARFALAGIVQGVADFPFQDESEIHDSLIPLVAQPDAVVFAHPRFLIEIGPTWRSLSQMRRTVGSCPYVLLTHLTLSYNQHILESVEQQVENLVYDVGDSASVRAKALGSLQRLLHGVEHGSFRSQKNRLKVGLERRVEIYRELVLSRLPNIFRYPRERDVFESVSKAHSLERRYATCLELLANYDSLSDDVHALSTLISDRSMNSLLSVISTLSALGILSVSTDVLGLKATNEEFAFAVLVLLATGLAIFATLRVLMKLLR